MTLADLCTYKPLPQAEIEAAPFIVPLPQGLRVPRLPRHRAAVWQLWRPLLGRRALRDEVVMFKLFSNETQDDHSGCFKPPVDAETKVVSRTHTKTELMF